MNGIFNPEGLVIEKLRKATNLIALNLLWILCSIPIITIGASTSALYSVTLKMAKNEESKIVRTFFASLKSNLKQGVILTLIFFFGGAVLFFDLIIIAAMEGIAKYIITVAFLMLALLFSCVVIYSFPLQAQFINPVSATLKNALLLSIHRFPLTVLMLIVNFAPVVITAASADIFFWMIPVWLFFVPAVNSYFCAKKFTIIFEPLVKALEKNTSEHD